VTSLAPLPPLGSLWTSTEALGDGSDCCGHGTAVYPAHSCCHRRMSRAVEESNRRLLRARDAMDRTYAQPLDVRTLARIAHVSEAHFIRTFRATFGETPHRYLQRRRVERAMFLLRETDRSVTDICLDVGFTSLGTFSRTFRSMVGEPPSAYRARADVTAAPACRIASSCWCCPARPRWTTRRPRRSASS
jgi:AraC-like DNA-binding protein